MALFEVCCPLYPLLEEGKAYPDNYQIPPRMRPLNSLNLRYLTSVLRESLLYQEKGQGDDEISIVSVLSPYSKFFHVMVIDLSPNLYMPSPELMSLELFSKFCSIVSKTIKFIEKKNPECICAGYNWSPYSFGDCEEKGGAQSIPTKFHFSVWAWDVIEKSISQDLSIPHQIIFGSNEYSYHFNHLIYDQIKDIKGFHDYFAKPIFENHSLFIPFHSFQLSSIGILPEFIHKISTTISLTMNTVSSHILSSNTYENQLNILQNVQNRELTENEIFVLRSPPYVLTIDECLQNCTLPHETSFIQAIYPAIHNRSLGYTSGIIWRKFFGYSIVFCESYSSLIQSGLYILPLPYCGTGGVVEALGCYLYRPENALALPDDLIFHNRLQWEMVK